MQCDFLKNKPEIDGQGRSTANSLLLQINYLFFVDAVEPKFPRVFNSSHNS